MKIGFICVGNSCRSQMAEGWAKEIFSKNIEVYSAGTKPSDQINPHAVTVMKEAGIDLSGQYPKLLEEIPDLDVLVTMGCNVLCPYKKSKHRVDWEITDPVGRDLEFFRETRDLIHDLVVSLNQELQEFANDEKI